MKIPTGKEPVTPASKRKQVSPEKDKLAATISKIKTDSPKQPAKKEPISKKPDPKQSPAKKATPKKGQKVESDTISIPAAEPETPKKHPAQGRVSVPPAEAGTPRRQPPPSRASIPPAEPETPKKQPIPGRASVPPAEPLTPRKKPPQSAVSIPEGEPETPRKQADAISIPAGSPETPRKVAVNKEDTISVPGAEPETPRKQAVDKTATIPAKPGVKAKTPAVKKATPAVKTPAVKTPAGKKKVDIKPTKLEVKADVKPAGKTIPRPNTNPYDTYTHKSRTQPEADSKTAPGPKKYGIDATMKQDEEDRFTKDIPNGRVIPFGYKSPPETPHKSGRSTAAAKPEPLTKEGTTTSITPASKPTPKKPVGKPQPAAKPGVKTPRPAGVKVPPKAADKNTVKSPLTARKAKVCFSLFSSCPEPKVMMCLN